MFVTGLKCTYCNKFYIRDEVEYVCTDDNATLDVQYDYRAMLNHLKQHGLHDAQNMWRYKTLMPVQHDAPEPPLRVGNTPLMAAPRLSEKLGMRYVWVKDDGRNPTASLKDRASALIVSKALAEDRRIVTTASTGNAAAALAGIAASVGLSTVIFVPASAPPAKITQLLVYGANVMLVNGTYDDAFDLCLQATDAFGWYCRNTGYNPYTMEGKKTVSFEIAEELADRSGEFRSPDVIAVSVGDGNIISGIHKGFKDLYELGLIDKVPRMLGVQAEGSSALHQAWQHRADPHTLNPITANTLADSISAGLPRDPIKAVRAVNETQGAYITVSDDAILNAIPALAQSTGVFAEPAAAATYAGLMKGVHQGIVDPDEETVIVITGNGLKDISTARKSVGQAQLIEPDLTAVRRIMNRFETKIQ